MRGNWILFEKYSLLGNTFIVVDEARSHFPDDAARAWFARWALDANFGIGGADNVIYLADDRFRIFEWDGSETLSCGNGLLCAAHWLGRRDDSAYHWRVWTELPSARPRAVRVGRRGDGWTWVDAGPVRATPAELFRRSGPIPADGIDILRLDSPNGILTGRLVFTGEPHLVFPGDDLLFSQEGDELVERIGSGINARYRDLFPAGVHVNFVQSAGPGRLRYRTWERAINRETLACGTGALACAYVSQIMGQAAPGRVLLLPHRARRHVPSAELHVTCTDAGLVLEGRPTHVCSGIVPAGVPFGLSHRQPERQDAHV
jgi:diaminopimelate epimerase